MIRYKISESELYEWIAKKSPTWLERAKEKTDTLEAVGVFQDGPPNWSEIKTIYMELQNNKCIYCERKLDSNIEFDIEHFRPKRAVSPWPALEDAQKKYSFETGSSYPAGYYLLAYAPLNYAASCKPCNNLKRNYFPISGTRLEKPSREIRDYVQEKPLLPYPIGKDALDPEKLIGFNGPLAFPKYKRGYKQHIAKVAIDIFALNTRDRLIEQRALLICNLFSHFKQSQSSIADDRTIANVTLNKLTSGHSEHTSCAKNFRELCEKAIPEATKIALMAARYLNALKSSRKYAQ